MLNDLLDMIIINAGVLFRRVHTGNKIRLVDFRTELTKTFYKVERNNIRKRRTPYSEKEKLVN